MAQWVTAVGIVAAGMLMVGCSAIGGGSGKGLEARKLRVNYQDSPRGIGDRTPRLSWELAGKSDARGQSQSAYRVIVASTKENAEKGVGDEWDTGKVESDQTAQVAYNGQKLLSKQAYWWTVKTWDEKGVEGKWGPVQRFTVGLLEQRDWTAEWVGYDAKASDGAGQDEATKLEGGKWVWITAGAAKDAPAETVRFRKVIDMPAGKSIKRATFAVTGDNSVRLFVNGSAGLSGTDFHKVYAENVNWMLKPGKNAVAVEAKNSGGPAGVTGKLTVVFETGEKMVVWVDETWKASRDAKGDWKKAEFDDGGWDTAKVIANVGDAPWGKVEFASLELPPPPYLRGEFVTADKKIVRATAYATALGLYELRLNGKRVGDLELTPGWEDYRHRVYYNTYDATEFLKKGGKNAIGVILGDGWYDGYVGYTGKRHTYEGEPRARVQLRIEYADGDVQTVGSDESWKATYGPIREADLLMGCTYDANLEKNVKGFDTPGFDDSKWDKVVTGAVGQSAKIPVEAYCGEPTKRFESLPAKSINEPVAGSYVFDLGQNMVGWAKFKLKGKAGQKITFRYAEMLNDDGTLYTTALRSARATDSYTPAKDGTFEWEPTFTFHGFRYVEVSGVDAKPDLGAVTGIVVHADMPRAGHIETSNKLVNQLFHNIIWGQKGNYLEVPTDCPQRDERLGWTGDAQFFVRTGAYNFDVAAFFNKWLIDLVQDSQMPNGGFTHVAPAIQPNDGGATAWQDAAPICTYAMYKFYGDTRNIERHWDHLTKFMNYLHATSKDLIRNEKPFGDWLHQGASAKGEVMGTAYYAYVARIMSEMAGAIGYREQEKEYGELADRIKAKFNKEFVKDDGTILESSQTGFALAFTMDLLRDSVKRAAAEQFREEVRKKDWHLGTGFIGTPRLLPGLQKAGETDVAYRLLLQDTFPSWLFQVKLGATTMWERWDGYRPEKGFQDPGMNSFNHYAFGSVGEWIYASVVGIDQKGVGFKKIVIHPRPGGELTYVKGSYDSINGPIVSEWEVKGGKIRMHVEIPVNTTAEVYVPGAGPVTESGKAAEGANGVKFAREEDGCRVYEVGSGKYEFVAPYGGT